MQYFRKLKEETLHHCKADSSKMLSNKSKYLFFVSFVDVITLVVVVMSHACPALGAAL